MCPPPRCALSLARPKHSDPGSSSASAVSGRLWTCREPPRAGTERPLVPFEQVQIKSPGADKTPGGCKGRDGRPVCLNQRTILPSARAPGRKAACPTDPSMAVFGRGRLFCGLERVCVDRRVDRDGTWEGSESCERIHRNALQEEKEMNTIEHIERVLSI